jgi:hypothetical protein
MPIDALDLSTMNLSETGQTRNHSHIPRNPVVGAGNRNLGRIFVKNDEFPVISMI